MPAEKYSKIIRLTRKSISLEMPKYQNNPKDVGQESLSAASVSHEEEKDCCGCCDVRSTSSFFLRPALRIIAGDHKEH